MSGKLSGWLGRGSCGFLSPISGEWGSLAALSSFVGMERAEKRLQTILKKSRQNGITPEALARLDVVKNMCAAETALRKKVYTVGAILSLLLIAASILTPNSECLVEMPVDTSKVFREAEDCNMCTGVHGVDKVRDISPKAFDEVYSSTYRPVVVMDGTKGWSAVDTFDFNFFKRLYTNRTGTKSECQFFPYKTEFESLQEALGMDAKRASLDPSAASWYIGWSNCNDDAGKELRKHYDRPYFLPDVSENIALSWIFMGGPGPGAHLHVDNVHYPSWQAQLRGRKVWRLAPPPECLYACREFQVTIEPGEIIVVDTNRWYHQTSILPGDISITIGSEFD